MKEHIKVENKTNNLGDLIGVSSSNDRISVAVSCAMAKRYLKVCLVLARDLLVPHKEVPEEAAAARLSPRGGFWKNGI